MDYSELAPDVRQKLLSMTMFMYDDTSIDMGEYRIYRTLDVAVRDYYRSVVDHMKSYSGKHKDVREEMLLKLSECDTAAAKKVYENQKVQNVS